MIEFLTIQYRMGRVTEAQLQRAVELGRITQAEYEQIVGNTNPEPGA
jgi:uncharacterized XkdX family phage protein